eukprot:jgi/Botrbrau1/17643/Bobra.0166s0074.1
MKGALAKTFVNISAIFSAVPTYFGMIAPFSTSSLTLWYLTAICLVLVEMGIPLIFARAPVLSVYTTTPPSPSPRSDINLLNQSASCTPVHMEMNSASTVDRATSGCSLLPQETAAPLDINT